MLRMAMLLIVAVAAALFALWGAQSPGLVTIEWFGQRIETTALFSVIALALGLAVLLPVLGFLLDAGGRMTFASERARRQRADDALAKALIAFDGGEMRQGMEHAIMAGKVLEEPRLVQVLRARAAEAKGDAFELERICTEMLAHAETELLGRKGLLDLALSKEDRTAALAHAQAALKLSQSAGWPALALAELRLQAFDWLGALEALDEAERRQAVQPEFCKRRRAVLLCAAASRCERDRDLPKAVDLAVRATRSAAALTPASILAARLLRGQGEIWKAVSVLEEAWAAAPHPAIAAAYRDVRADAGANERMQSLEALAKTRPDHRESKLLTAELAMERQDWSLAWDSLDHAYRLLPSSRVCGLFATLCRARGDEANTRHWVGQAICAPREPDWSDLDPEDSPFQYGDAEWRALASEFGDRGRLVHMRLERGLADAPFSAGFVTANGAGSGRLTGESPTELRAMRLGERSLPGTKAS